MDEKIMEYLRERLDKGKIARWTDALKGFQPLKREEMVVRFRSRVDVLKEINDFVESTRAELGVPRDVIREGIRAVQELYGLNPNYNEVKDAAMRTLLRAMEYSPKTFYSEPRSTEVSEGYGRTLPPNEGCRKLHEMLEKLPAIISAVLSKIPSEIWGKIVENEPEWRYMHDLLQLYGFGRFAVLMVVTGLNDFQLKGRADVAYWPKIRELLRREPIPTSTKDLQLILTKFYAKERLRERKLERLDGFLSSKLANWLWNSSPSEVASNFLRVWEDLAETMRQERSAKTITFAMKCLGIALLMSGKYDFNFEKIPIPVDYRVREFTRRLGVEVDDEGVRKFWSRVLEEIRKSVRINMIHLDSLVWQIGTLEKPEILNYFKNLGFEKVGEDLLKVVL